MIYVTGDIHAGIDIMKLVDAHERKGILREGDLLIICGDFGLPFFPTDHSDEALTDKQLKEARESYFIFMEWFSEQKYTVLWADGNHDNHTFWSSQPVSQWNGGRVNIHPLAENVIHLKRGEYYNIDGKTVWVMGGAESHDRIYRTEGESWWREEVPSDDEMRFGLENLRNHGSKADIIITHTMPSTLQFSVAHKMYAAEPTSIYFDEIYRTVDFGYWFCGHFHVDRDCRPLKIRALYNDIVNAEDYLNEVGWEEQNGQKQT